MIDADNYGIMKSKYGMVSSWAVWKEPGDTPRSNTSDMSWVENEDLLNILNTGYVFVGLNGSSTHGDQTKGGTIYWKNFHSDYSLQNDFKLRYALMGTKYWGSYITDIIKLFFEVDSKKVGSYLRNHPEVLEENVRNFEEEIAYLGEKPVLIAMGDKAYSILESQLGQKYKILKIMHYSYTIGKEDYRKKVLEVLDEEA